MRKVLAVVIVAAILSIGALSAFAQVPNVQVYFDENLTQTQSNCGGFLVPDTLNVVANNFNMLLSTIEFSIIPPTTKALYVGDVHRPDALWLGSSPTGVTITYSIPHNAFVPFVCMRYAILWLCDTCDAVSEPIIVGPEPFEGVVAAIEWQTFRKVVGVGMTSLICPGVISTEESTWGRVKALYSE